MSGLSIGDLIASFRDPEPTPEPDVVSAKAWFDSFQSWLSEDYEKTVHHERKPGLHASALSSACARRNVLMRVYGTHDPPFTAGNYFTFDVGHAMHYWWQERYLGPKQELWGDWMCVACPCPKCGPHLAKLGDLSLEDKRRVWAECGSCRSTGRKVVRGLMPLECGCGVPWQDAIRYMELPVVNKALNYVGHTDGVLVHKPNRRVFEFKTISPSEYDKYPGSQNPQPKPEHVIQAHAYMEPLGLSETLIVYENKGSQCKWSVNMFGQFVAGEPKVVPFIVKFDQALWDGVVARVHEHHRSVRAIEDHKKEGKRLPRALISDFERICSDKKCDLAARCPVSRECFSHD